MRHTIKQLINVGAKVLPVVVLAVCLGFAGQSFIDAVMLPEVYKSYMTKQCIKVVDSSGDTILEGCDNIPNKHFIVWVK